MAFTSRSKRYLSNFSQVSSQTSENVGPGSYVNPEMNLNVGLKYCVAPFNSSVPRMKKNDSNTTPGPGSYQNSHFVKSRYPRYRSKSAMFKSNTVRFQDKTDCSPGPGDYNFENVQKEKPLSKTVPIQKKVVREKDDGIIWVKVNTVPSIPSGTNYGYEESEHGKLIPQKPNIQKFDGTPRNSVGPGEYNTTKKKFPSTYKGIATFKSTTKRSSFKRVTNTPGPGSYSKIEKVEKNFDDPFQNSSSFASTTKRINFSPIRSSKTPGPGTYLTQRFSSGFRKDALPEKYQNFGSSSVRPFNLPHDYSKKKDVTPGPGHFLRETSTIKKKKEGHGAFNSGSIRFRNKKKKFPGPGAYEYLDNISDEVKRKKIGKFGVFGTTSTRFIRHKRARSSPSVTKYKPKSFVDVQKKSKLNLSPAFLSKSERLKIKKKYGPGPGAYSVGFSWGKGGWRGKVLHAPQNKKKTKRFVTISKKDNVPGPGLYDVVSGFDSLSKKKNFSYNKSVFSCSGRFFEKKKKVKRWFEKRIPGPGSYNLEQEWGIRSYNVTIL